MSRAAALVTMVVATLMAGACGGETETAPPPATSTAEPAEREAAPDIRGTTLDGKTISLADYRGKRVIVNLWSSW